MRTEFWAVASAVAATLLAAGATFLLKRGAIESRLSFGAFHISSHVIWSILLYLLSSLFFLIALLGMQFSVLLPSTTLEYVWVTLLAKGYLHERIGIAKRFGIACVVVGIVLIGLGS